MKKDGDYEGEDEDGEEEEHTARKKRKERVGEGKIDRKERDGGR